MREREKIATKRGDFFFFWKERECKKTVISKKITLNVLPGVITHASLSVALMQVHRLPISERGVDRSAEHGRLIALVNVKTAKERRRLRSENSPVFPNAENGDFHCQTSSPFNYGLSTMISR